MLLAITSTHSGCTQESGLGVTPTLKNQISGSTYDAAGNLTNAPGMGSHTYDAENRMTTTAGVTYTCDGDGRRVRKSNGKLYWYGAGSDPLMETDLAGNTNNATFQEYLFFGGKRVAKRDFNNVVNYYFSDHLGSSRVVTSAAGAILDDSDFYPFGGERVITSSSGNHYKFTSKERDTESALDYFGARHYSNASGRFYSTDPLNIPALRLIKPKRFGQIISNPQNWNAYAYTLNNPLNYLDPDGYLTILIHGTWANPGDENWGKALVTIQASLDDQSGQVFTWTGGNTDKDRREAAQALAEFIKKYTFKRGEKLNIVAHSHGGNVAFLASHLTDRKFDLLVTLGTPIREYQPDMRQIRKLINVYSNEDSVQPNGGFSMVYDPWLNTVHLVEAGPAGRTLDLPGVINVNATDEAKSHSDLWQKASVWLKKVVPELKK